MTEKICDRCGHFYQPHPDWLANPLCNPCLIGTRRAERFDAWTRPTTTRELEHAWRHTTFQHWQNQLA